MPRLPGVASLRAATTRTSLVQHLPSKTLASHVALALDSPCTLCGACAGSSSSRTRIFASSTTSSASARHSSSHPLAAAAPQTQSRRDGAAAASVAPGVPLRPATSQRQSAKSIDAFPSTTNTTTTTTSERHDSSKQRRRLAETRHPALNRAQLDLLLELQQYIRRPPSAPSKTSRDAAPWPPTPAQLVRYHDELLERGSSGADDAAHSARRDDERGANRCHRLAYQPSATSFSLMLRYAFRRSDSRTLRTLGTDALHWWKASGGACKAERGEQEHDGTGGRERRFALGEAQGTATTRGVWAEGIDLAQLIFNLDAADRRRSGHRASSDVRDWTSSARREWGHHVDGTDAETQVPPHYSVGRGAAGVDAASASSATASRLLQRDMAYQQLLNPRGIPLRVALGPRASRRRNGARPRPLSAPSHDVDGPEQGHSVGGGGDAGAAEPSAAARDFGFARWGATVRTSVARPRFAASRATRLDRLTTRWLLRRTLARNDSAAGGGVGVGDDAPRGEAAEDEDEASLAALLRSAARHDADARHAASSVAEAVAATDVAAPPSSSGATRRARRALERWTEMQRQRARMREWVERRLARPPSHAASAAPSPGEGQDAGGTTTAAQAGGAMQLPPTWLLLSALRKHAEMGEVEQTKRIVVRYLERLSSAASSRSESSPSGNRAASVDSVVEWTLTNPATTYAVTRPKVPPSGASLLNAVLGAHLATSRPRFEEMLATVEELTRRPGFAYKVVAREQRRQALAKAVRRPSGGASEAQDGTGDREVCEDGRGSYSVRLDANPRCGHGGPRGEARGSVHHAPSATNIAHAAAPTSNALARSGDGLPALVANEATLLLLLESLRTRRNRVRLGTSLVRQAMHEWMPRLPPPERGRRRVVGGGGDDEAVERRRNGDAVAVRAVASVDGELQSIGDAVDERGRDGRADRSKAAVEARQSRTTATDRDEARLHLPPASPTPAAAAAVAPVWDPHAAESASAALRQGEVRSLRLSTRVPRRLLAWALSPAPPRRLPSLRRRRRLGGVRLEPADSSEMCAAAADPSAVGTEGEAPETSDVGGGRDESSATATAAASRSSNPDHPRADDARPLAGRLTPEQRKEARSVLALHKEWRRLEREAYGARQADTDADADDEASAHAQGIGGHDGFGSAGAGQGSARTASSASRGGWARRERRDGTSSAESSGSSWTSLASAPRVKGEERWRWRRVLWRAWQHGVLSRTHLRAIQ